MNDLDFKISSINIVHRGSNIKIQNNKVFIEVFGTTIYNQKTPHYNWMEVKEDNMKPDFKQFLTDNNLIKF